MKYDVHLTYEGDPALCAQWAGFAKKKSREFGQFCQRNGQPFGVKYYELTAEVNLKVRYANGLQFAHIKASIGHFGVIFWITPQKESTVYTIPPHHQPVATTQRLVSGKSYSDAMRVDSRQQPYSDYEYYDIIRTQFGNVVCQDVPRQPAITIHRHPQQYFIDDDPPGIYGRYDGVGGMQWSTGEDWGNKEFCMGGVAYPTGGKRCHGAFKYKQCMFVVLLDGSVSRGLDDSVYKNRGTFSGPCSLDVYQADDINAPASWQLLTSINVTGLNLAGFYNGAFHSSDTGALSAAAFLDGSGNILFCYLTMSGNAVSGFVASASMVNSGIKDAIVAVATGSQHTLNYTTLPTPPYNASPTVDAFDEHWHLHYTSAKFFRGIDIASIGGEEVPVAAWIEGGSGNLFSWDIDNGTCSHAVERYESHYNEAAGEYQDYPIYNDTYSATEVRTGNYSVSMVIRKNPSLDGATWTEVAQKSGLLDSSVSAGQVTNTVIFTHTEHHNVLVENEHTVISSAWTDHIIDHCAMADLKNGVMLSLRVTTVMPDGLSSEQVIVTEFDYLYGTHTDYTVDSWTGVDNTNPGFRGVHDGMLYSTDYFSTGGWPVGYLPEGLFNSTVAHARTLRHATRDKLIVLEPPFQKDGSSLHTVPDDLTRIYRKDAQTGDYSRKYVEYNYADGNNAYSETDAIGTQSKPSGSVLKLRNIGVV